MKQKDKELEPQNTEAPQAQNKNKSLLFRLTTIIISVFLGISAFLLFSAEFFPEESTDKFIGFPNFHIFLFTLSPYLTIFSMSMFILWLSNFFDGEYIFIRKYATGISILFMSIGIYFLLWVFTVHDDFPRYYYEIAFVVSGVFSAIVINKALNRMFLYIYKSELNVKNLRFNMSRMIKLVFTLRTDFFFPMSSKAINEESIEEVKNKLDDLDQKIKYELEEIAKD